MTPKAVKSQYFLLLFAFAGCLGWVPAPESAVTPEPALTSTPAPIPFDPSRQIVELDNYGRELGLSQEILEILRSSYSGGKASEEYKNTLKDVMLSISQIPERYGTYKFREGAAKRVMEDMRITDEDKKAVIEYENLVKFSISEMEELKKDDFTLEDGKQTDLEKSYLTNPDDPKLASELKKYYLSEIEKIYPELASELKKLPELAPLKLDKKSLEAIEDILGLLLTAKPYKNYNDRFKTNIPKENETWEAFELMIKGGTPDPKDYQYSVPNYNTDLQALLWIAEQNEFKKSDTLAQAIVIDNGLYITMGDEKVRAAVYKGTNGLLEFFRETNLWQLENVYYLLEDYPLEAKIALVYNGNMMKLGYASFSQQISQQKKFNINMYSWDTMSVNTLKAMRRYLMSLSLKEKNYGSISFLLDLEDYLYFQKRWIYKGKCESSSDDIDVDGIKLCQCFGNVDWQFQYLKENGRGIGVCNDEMLLMYTFSKSFGIASSGIINAYNNKLFGHTYTIFYNATDKKWVSYSKHIEIGLNNEYAPNGKIYWAVFIPPINQKHYINPKRIEFPAEGYYGNGYLLISNENEKLLYSKMFTDSIPTTQMKQWLLYP